MATYTYKGMTIEPCDRAPGEHNGKWIIQGVHTPTGMIYGDDICIHTQSIREARERIDEIREERITHAR